MRDLKPFIYEGNLCILESAVKFEIQRYNHAADKWNVRKQFKLH